MFRDMKYFRILTLPVLILLFTSFNSLKESKFHVKTVVIDAGHGGKDPGTSSNGIKEKDVVLKIALETGRIIQENLSDVKVIYTRTTDKFIKLHDRAEIANKNNADVFISIHCNAVNSSQARGTETWVMGLHKSKDNLSSAMKKILSFLWKKIMKKPIVVLTRTVRKLTLYFLYTKMHFWKAASIWQKKLKISLKTGYKEKAVV